MEKDFDQNTYQFMAGDLYIQEVRVDHFTIHRYTGENWEHLGGGHCEQDIKTLTASMQFLGESKGFRRYYRLKE